MAPRSRRDKDMSDEKEIKKQLGSSTGTYFPSFVLNTFVLSKLIFSIIFSPINLVR
jgi:hypothetical protein